MQSNFRNIMSVVAFAVIAGGAASAQDCEPSKWGADDEIGAANHVGPQQVLDSVKLVKEGKSMPLGLTINSESPAFGPRSLALQIVQPGQQLGEALDWGYPATYNDDVIQLWLGIGSQIDGLSHFGLDGHHYNCNDAREFASITGATAMSVHNIPPLVGRGVLFDMVSFFGGDPLEAGRGISAQDIKDAEQKSGVKIGKGDVVLFHTGWVDSKMTSDPVAFMAGEPGITNDAAEYLAMQDVMAVGSDTWGVGVSPAVEGDKLHYEHVILPKENGIYILEGMNTGPLAAEDVVEFMFVLGQPRVEGTVQMIINPVALW